MIQLVCFLIGCSFATAVIAIRAGARARAARADLLTLVRVLEHRAGQFDESCCTHPSGDCLGGATRRLQSDLRATFPEFFTDQERAR